MLFRENIYYKIIIILVLQEGWKNFSSRYFKCIPKPPHKKYSGLTKPAMLIKFQSSNKTWTDGTGHINLSNSSSLYFNFQSVAFIFYRRIFHGSKTLLSSKQLFCNEGDEQLTQKLLNAAERERVSWGVGRGRGCKRREPLVRKRIMMSKWRQTLSDPWVSNISWFLNSTKYCTYRREQLLHKNTPLCMGHHGP